MALSSRGASRWRETIASYQQAACQKGDCVLLARLSKSLTARSAVERLNLDDWRTRALIKSCITAARLADEFQERIAQAHNTLYTTPRLREAVFELRRFLKKNKLKTWAVPHLPMMRRGLAALFAGIRAEQCFAREAFAQYGATRKTKAKSAAQDAAIWTLAEAVKLETGKARYGEVADLASAILGKTISEDMVKHAVRLRRKQYNATQDKRIKRGAFAVKKMLERASDNSHR